MIAWSFPGAGYRNETGALTNVGTNGYYWSTSPNVGGSSNSGYLKFINDGTLSWTLNGNRAAALSVRCVSELTTGFIIARSADKLLAVRSVAINKFSNPLAFRRGVSFTKRISSVARGFVPFRRAGCSDRDCCRSFRVLVIGTTRMER